MSWTTLGMRRLGGTPLGSEMGFWISSAVGAPFPPNFLHSGCKKKTGHLSPWAAGAPWYMRKAHTTKWGAQEAHPGHARSMEGGCSPGRKVH